MEMKIYNMQELQAFNQGYYLAIEVKELTLDCYFM